VSRSAFNLSKYWVLPEAPDHDLNKFSWNKVNKKSEEHDAIVDWMTSIYVHNFPSKETNEFISNDFSTIRKLYLDILHVVVDLLK